MSDSSPQKFEIPKGAAQRKCRSCKAPIFWVRTAGGKPMPVNPDGTTHFATCPEGKEWSGSSRAITSERDSRDLNEAEELEKQTPELALTTNWRERSLLSLDFEATSADPLEALPVSFASLYIQPDGSQHNTSKHGLVNPGTEIPADSTAIHGITDNDVKGAPAIKQAVAMIIGDMSYARAAKSPLVIFNARYDLTLLHRLAAQFNWIVPELPVLDPLVLDRWLDPYRKGKRTLGSVCEHYGVSLGDAHDATADAQATAQLAYAMYDARPDLRRSPDELHAAQAKAFEAWREGLVAYRRSKGDPNFDIEPGWPISEARVVANE